MSTTSPVKWAPPRRGRGHKSKAPAPKANASAPSTAAHAAAPPDKAPSHAKSATKSRPKQQSVRTRSARSVSSASLRQLSNGPRRFRPAASAIPPATAYQRYREAVDAREVGFFQVDPRTWVAERHDVAIGDRLQGVDAWTVVQCHVDLQQRLTYSCSPCPDFVRHGTCVHVLVLSSNDPPPFCPFSITDNPPCICFEHTSVEDCGPTLTTFVCMSSVESPVFVTHYGKYSDLGTWTCSKDNLAICAHVDRARGNPAFAAFVPKSSCDADGADGGESGEEEQQEEVLQAAAERERGA